jgi:hypothetical protein
VRTLREYLAEAEALMEDRARRSRDRLAALNDLIDGLEGRDLAVYRSALSPSPDVTNYEVARKRIRENVRSGESSALEIACDHCGTELFGEPGLLMSSPPKKKIGCPGCGWIGFIRA